MSEHNHSERNQGKIKMSHNARLFLKANAVFAALALAGITSAQSTATLSGGRLTLQTPNGDQSVQVEVGPSAGAVRVYGFPGLADGQSYTGVSGVSVRTGAGNDKVEVSVHTSQSFDVRVDTQGGESEASVKWQLLGGALSARADISIAATGGLMKFASVEVSSSAQDANVAINTGNATDASIKVESPNNTNYLGVKVAGSAQKSSLDLSSSAAALDFDATGGNANASNELKYNITQNRSGGVTTRFAISTSNADDDVYATISAPGSIVTHTGTINTLGGNDDVVIETNSFQTLTGTIIDGGEGDDFLAQIVKGRFQMSQTLGATMFGRGGDDQLIVKAEGGIWGSGIAADIETIIDCGAGNDRFNAFGIIRSCESRM
jgi:hypothetical protein